jgi:tRNA (guanine-N7-)-methyltransferase
MTIEDVKRRRIRSFVLRTGRMTEGQQKAYQEGWEKYGLNVDDGLLDPEQSFGRIAPMVLEIGFGMGHSLSLMAEQAPDKNFIGVEVHTPGVGKLLALADEKSLKNLRVYEHDAVEVLAKCIADESLDTVQIYFPDPWHKKKHKKRRLVQSDFIQALRAKLKIGGVIHLATDWEDYADHMMEVMSLAEGFVNQAGEYGFAEKPESRPETKFERRGERLGHGVWDMLFEKTC